jgi:hypothetical protein
VGQIRAPATTDTNVQWKLVPNPAMFTLAHPRYERIRSMVVCAVFIRDPARDLEWMQLYAHDVGATFVGQASA